MKLTPRLESADSIADVIVENVSVSPKFSNKTPPKSKCSPYASNHTLRIWHPVQGSIGKHRVKFVGKVEFVSVDYPSVKTAIHGGLHHHGTQVDTDSLAAKLLNLFG